MKTMKITFILLAIIPLFVISQESGVASYYSHSLAGRKTSDGSRYHPDSMTCAHKTYPFGTYLYVRNPENDFDVIVKVTDRGPHTRNRMIDLSYAAAYQLDIIRKGLAKVEVTKLDFLPEPFSLIPIPKSYLAVNEFPIISPKLKVKIPQKQKSKSKIIQKK